MADLSMLAMAAALCLGAPAGSQVQGLPSMVNVRADRLQAGLDGAVTADGNVVLKGEGLTVHADRLEYDAVSGKIRVTGHVTIEEPTGGTFSAESVDLDAATLTGGIREGVIRPPGTQLWVRGGLISRTGPEEYEVRDAVFTSCPGECPDWSFSASRVTVRREGYLTARSASFRIRDVPVFYSPFLIYPVKTKRQSGLLIPEIRFTEATGWEGAFPVYLTIGPSADATLTPRTFSRDATGLEVEVRYRLDLGGGGNWSGFAMDGTPAGRWYHRGDTAIPASSVLWLRGRWYDAGDPDAPADFGRTFDERYPGAMSRHGTLEFDRSPFSAWAGQNRILSDAKSARAGTEGSRLDYQEAGAAGRFRYGPVAAAMEARWTVFEDDSDRLFLAPEASLRVSGPGPMAGRVHASAVLASSGEGTRGDSMVLTGIEEGFSVGREYGWGRHRLDAGVSWQRATEACFAEGSARDAYDRSAASAVVLARLRSLITAGSSRWDVIVAGWGDGESGEEDVYGSTRFTYRALSVEAGYNHDGQYELVLPSPRAPTEKRGDWSATIGVSGRRAGFTVSRQAGKGSMDLSQAECRFPVGRVDLSGRIQYDHGAGKAAESSATMSFRGRCWTAGLTHGQSGDRREWRLAVSLQ